MLEILINLFKLIKCKLIHKEHNYVIVEDTGMTYIAKCKRCNTYAEFVNENYFNGEWEYVS